MFSMPKARLVFPPWFFFFDFDEKAQNNGHLESSARRCGWGRRRTISRRDLFSRFLLAMIRLQPLPFLSYETQPVFCFQDGASRVLGRWCVREILCLSLCAHHPSLAACCVRTLIRFGRNLEAPLWSSLSSERVKRTWDLVRLCLFAKCVCKSEVHVNFPCWVERWFSSARRNSWGSLREHVSIRGVLRFSHGSPVNRINRRLV